jgi:hypothetical protein
MSHESGFRRGSRSFTQKGGQVRQRKPKGSRAFDRRMEKRFHEHERQAQEEAVTEGETETQEEPQGD